MTDPELITRAAGGDRLAFQSLYERHWRAVYSFAWLLTKSVQDAEDITQECFLAVVREPRRFDPARAQFRTWLIAMVRNQYLQRRRRMAHQAGPTAVETSEAPLDVDEALIREERAEAVHRAVEALSPVQQEVLYLFEFEGLSLAETAVVLEIEPNAVKARLYRAREQLRRLLTPLRQALSGRSEDTHDG